MKNRINIIAATILISLTLSTSLAQVTYTWIGGSSANFTTAASWSPIRLNGQVSDILCFNCGGTVNALNVQQQTIGQLLITNNTHVIFTPASGNPKVLSINGGTGDDLVLESGSIFEINGATPQLGVFLKVGTTASINGTVIITGNQSHYLNANDANSLVFHNGSSLTQNTPGYIFTNAGTINAVAFENGSTFTINNSLASNPFGLTAPNSKVVFNPNSTFVLRNTDTAALSLSGRTYGNVVIDYSSSMQVNEALTSNTIFNNITINAGSSLSLNNSNSSFTSTLTINGNLNAIGNLTLGNNNQNNLNVKFDGSNNQTISGNGTISLNSVLINNNVSLTNSRLTANTTVSSNGNLNVHNAYIVGSVTKYFSSSIKSNTFEIGTANGYSPVTIIFNNVSAPGYLTVSCSADVYHLVQDSSTTLKRFWTITNDGIQFDSYSAAFHYLSNDFNTNLIESRDEANMIAARFGSNVEATVQNININLRDTLNNLIGIDGMSCFGTFTMVKNGTSDLNQQNHLNNVNNQNSLKNSSSNSPTSFGISQNYPNPFNPTTKIDYQLPSTSSVTIKLYDITGKAVSTLVNSTQDAGNYTIQVNSHNLASGVYFYNINATSGNNHFEHTVKMIVAK